MSTSKAKFEKWFVTSLVGLRENGDAGFIFVFTAFPLLERYLRRKSGSPDGYPLNDAFFNEIGLLFGEVAGREREFWNCYRNGLLHQATFSTAKLDTKKGIWIPLPGAGISGHDSRPIHFIPETSQFFLNPLSFFDVVTTSILADFATYEGSASVYYPLPSVTDQTTLTPKLQPINLPSAGSNSP